MGDPWVPRDASAEGTVTINNAGQCVGLVARGYEGWEEFILGPMYTKRNAWIYGDNGTFWTCGKDEEGLQLPWIKPGDQIKVTFRQGLVSFYHNGQRVRYFKVYRDCDQVAMAIGLLDGRWQGRARILNGVGLVFGIQ